MNTAFNDTVVNLDETPNHKKIENDNFKVLLFPIHSDNVLSSKNSELLYNAKVTHKPSHFVMSFPVRKLKDGTLLIGGSSKISGYRGLIDEYKNGKSYERLAVPNPIYIELLDLINKVD